MTFVPNSARHHGTFRQTAIDRLNEAGAVRRDRAQPLIGLSASERRQVDRLVERGVIRRTPAGSYYLDRDGLSDMRGRQRTIAFSLFVVVAGVVAGFVLTSA